MENGKGDFGRRQALKGLAAFTAGSLFNRAAQVKQGTSTARTKPGEEKVQPGSVIAASPREQSLRLLVVRLRSHSPSEARRR